MDQYDFEVSQDNGHQLKWEENARMAMVLRYSKGINLISTV